MKNGFVPVGGGIVWFEKNDESGLFGFAQALPATTCWFRRTMLEAYRCRQCRLVLFRYGKQVDDPNTFEHQ